MTIKKILKNQFKNQKKFWQKYKILIALVKKVH